MATHAKYTPAAQVDPDEHDDYTQAPPSYQAEASSANDEERLFAGGHRSSEDNIPDDFKVKLFPTSPKIQESTPVFR